MAAPDIELISLFKEWVWAPALAIAGWAWNRNIKEHDMLWKAHNKRIEEIQAVRKDAGDSHSSLMDRIVTHVDDSVGKALASMQEEDSKLHAENQIMRGHIEKLFENAEKDRMAFRDMLTMHVQRSEDRHIELLKGQQDMITLIHNGLAQKVDK